MTGYVVCFLWFITGLSLDSFEGQNTLSNFVPSVNIGLPTDLLPGRIPRELSQTPIPH